MDTNLAGEESRGEAESVTDCSASEIQQITESEGELLFIPYRGASAAIRRKVRSNAARTSASTRIATTAQRHEKRLFELQAASTSSEDISVNESRTALEGRRRRSRRSKTTQLVERRRTEATRSDAGPSQPAQTNFLLNFALGLPAEGRQYVAAICSSAWSSFESLTCASFRSALFQALILFIKTVWIFNPEQRTAPDVTGRQVILVKSLALNAVKSCLDLQPADSGPLAAAIAMLAAWEMKYGSEKESEIHIEAWKKVLRERSSEVNVSHIEGHMLALSDHITYSLRTHCRMVALSDTQPLYNQVSTMNKRFSIFMPCDTSIRPIFYALDQLTRLDLDATDAVESLREINLLCFLAEVPEGLSEPEMAYCLHQVRNSVCALNGRLYTDPRIAARVDYIPPLVPVLNAHLAKVRSLGLQDFTLLIGTAYQEVSFWCLWIVSAALATWDDQTLQILKHFLDALGLKTWEDIETTLSRYAYFEEHLDEASHALFNDIVAHA